MTNTSSLLPAVSVDADGQAHRSVAVVIAKEAVSDLVSEGQRGVVVYS